MRASSSLVLDIFSPRALYSIGLQLTFDDLPESAMRVGSERNSSKKWDKLFESQESLGMFLCVLSVSFSLSYWIRF